MSWDQLRSVIAEQNAAVADDRRNLLLACPNDGEPYTTGPDGQLFCPFDGYRP